MPGTTHAALLTSQGHCLSCQYPELRGKGWYQSLQVALADGYTTVELELVVPGLGREAVKSALAGNIDSLEPVVFGTTQLVDDAGLEQLQSWCDNVGLKCAPWVAVGDSAGWIGHEKIVELANQSAVLRSDGVVYKDSVYGRWAKEKNQRTIDCYVTGVVPGVGKYWGQVGSLRCSVLKPTEHENTWQHIEIANVSGMTDELRAEITLRDEKTWKRRVLEVEYERAGSAGRLQHPRFVAWREDKPWNECFIDQDPELAEIWERKSR